MNEIERRQRKWQSVHRAWQQDPTLARSRAELVAERPTRAVEALKLLEELRATGDVETFRNDLQAWSHLPGYDAFRGFGMMFVHQVVKATDDPIVSADLLVDALSAPTSDDDAAQKIRRFVTHVERIKQAGQPAPRRAPFVLSLFWSMADNDRWPCLWQSADKVLTTLGWLTPPGDLDTWYLEYRDIVATSGLTSSEAEALLRWVDGVEPFTGLDPAIVDRCIENTEIAHTWQDNGKAFVDPDDAVRSERNIRAVNGELRLVSTVLEGRVSEAIGRKVTPRLIGLKYSNSDCFRSDSYISWQTGTDATEPSLWLWASDSGVTFGLMPADRGRGWTAKVADALTGHLPPGMEFIRYHNRVGDRIEPVGNAHPGGQFLIGRHYPDTSALGDPRFAEEIERVAAALQPVVDQVVTLAGGNDPLADLVSEFRTSRPYPGPADRTHNDDRAEFASALTPEALTVPDLMILRQIINTGRYGGPGPMSILNTTLTTGEQEDVLARFGATLSYLLWDETQPIADRIDRVLDKEDLGFPGLGPSIVMKFLAITHPDRFIPTFPLEGQMGKITMLETLSLDPLGAELKTTGQRQVASNDALRGALDPHFPDDPWGAAQFLYWLIEHRPPKTSKEKREPELSGSTIADFDLGALADALLVDVTFLEEVRSLLASKRQIIFYGPPGTGKTYIAKRLAETLVPDSGRRAIVQFHPSTSYEDFFEGYRPRTNSEGLMTYELTPGPLARMAELAAAAPNDDHIVIIDEINRANLPRVFGELLFLLEYRDESVQILNRPDAPFSLPPNLYFIGTMNTADRSIALVDAALRRRFHFVPFFPEQDHMEGLLRRWLERNGGDPRIATLVEQVNQELVVDVGEHLQIGPSYFMQRSISEQHLRQIWKYSIEPFVEEQLFGQTGEIKRYRWDEVRTRFWATLQGDGPTDADPLDA